MESIKKYETQLAMRSDLVLARDKLDDGLLFKDGSEKNNSELATLLASAFPDEKWDEIKVAEQLTAADDVSKVRLLYLDGILIGTASARENRVKFPGQGYVHWVAVLPTLQNRGYGKILVKEVLHTLFEENLWPAILETDDHRLGAIKSYLSVGFAPHCLQDDHATRWSKVFYNLARPRND
jgi:mycothiol synthase